jgi:uncharacterized protein (DUF1330 family)
MGLLEARRAEVAERGVPAHVYEAGLMQRTVVIEFDSVDHAKAAHYSSAYQEALAALSAIFGLSRQRRRSIGSRVPRR